MEMRNEIFKFFTAFSKGISPTSLFHRTFGGVWNIPFEEKFSKTRVTSKKRPMDTDRDRVLKTGKGEVAQPD
jgi:hypothetical protein